MSIQGRGDALAIVVAAVAMHACSGSSSTQTPAIPEPTPCERAERLLAQAIEQRAQGYLGRARAAIEDASTACPSASARDALSRILRELWLDEQTLAAATTDEDRATARLLYNAGQILRNRDASYAAALARFGESYALWPHPLTVVQMALTHEAAGDAVEYRKANARALAIAEHTQGVKARAVSQRGHLNPVTAVAYHPTRPVVVSGAEYGGLIAWDLTSGRVIRSQTDRSGGIRSLVFSPDGTRFAAGVYTSAKLWDAETGTELQVFEEGERTVNAVAFSPDGATLALASGERLILWHPIAGGATRDFAANDRQVSTAFSPDGVRVAAGSEDGVLRVWDVESGELIHELRDRASSIDALAFDSSGATVAVARGDGTVGLWDVVAGRLTRDIAAHSTSAVSVAFGPAGGVLATSSRADAAIKLWNPASGRALGELVGHEAGVRAMALSPDGTQLVSSSDDLTVKVWNVASRELVRTLSGRGQSSEVAFDPSGSSFAAGLGDGTIRLWRGDGLSAVSLLEGDGHRVTQLRFGPDGARLASGGIDGTARVWTVDSGTAERTLTGHTNIVWSLAFAPDGNSIATGSSDGTVRLWDLSSTQRRRILRADGGATALVFNDEGTRLAAAATGAELWKVPGGEPIALSSSVDLVMALHVFFDASSTPLMLAFADDEDVNAPNRLTLWNAASGHRLWTITPEEQVYSTAAPNPQRTRLAVAMYEVVLIVDVATGELIHTLRGHSQGVEGLAFTPDGRRLASMGSDKNTQLWDVATGALLATLLVDTGGDWVLAATDGRVDGSSGERGGESLVYWQVGDLQLPGFVGWQRYHSPGLLADVLR